MSNIPPYQMSAPPGGPPPNNTGNKTAPWVWVLVALAGMCAVCGVVGAAILFPVFAQARISAKKSISLSNAKQIAISVQMYAADFDDRMPPIDNGPAVAGRIEKYIMEDTGGPRRGRSKTYLKDLAAGYTWNTATSKLELGTIDNSSIVWMFYSTEPADVKSVSMAYLDGHTRIITRENLAGQTSIKPIIEKAKN